MRKWLMLGAAWVAVVAHAKGPGTQPPDWPVAAMQVISAASYEAGTAAARAGATPVEIALKVVGPFEGSRQYIVQANEGAEVAVRSTVQVVRDGLLDDALRGDRWDIFLARGADGWAITQVKHAWSCRRGAAVPRFDTARCP